MNCPDPIKAVVLEFLHLGVLTCRLAGWDPDPERCAVEADHIHNLPNLLADYSPDKLQYYWDVERPIFATRGDPKRLWRW